MRANEFVKKFGWDVATKLSKEMRGMTESVADGVAGWGQSEWDKLKHLVESHEYIESFGGLREAKRTFEMRHGVINLDGWDKLKLAIADVESYQ